MNWEIALKFFGGTTLLGLLGLLLKHFVVSAPVTFQARRNDAATLISDLQRRVTMLERQVKAHARALTHSSRERDALFLRHDVVRDGLLLSAEMHEKGEHPGDVLIRQWKAVPDSKAVVEGVPHDSEELASPEPEGQSLSGQSAST